MWLVCAEDGRVVPAEPKSLVLPSGLETGQKLVALFDDCRRALRALRPVRVLVLDPEANNQLTFAKSRGRVTGETLVSLAAAELDIPCNYISRKRVRARLGLPAGGRLSSLVDQVVDEVLAPNWTDKRDLAALAAL